MRPISLEMAGFASFRDQTKVDFEDADLFVLTGPTGSGKSSVIDAMIFALYGRVPRYDEKSVEPVIHKGSAECRVRLDFSVSGQDYSAVRVVGRTASGATTKDARLEVIGGQSIAGKAREMTGEVAALLGLTFEHFNRCVVLPQGDFAEFLHATPGDRQDLLVELLRLGLFREVGRAANERAARAKERLAFIDEVLAGDLADATPEQLEAAETQAAALAGLVEQVEALTKEADAHRAATAELHATAGAIRDRAAAVEAITAPTGTDELSARLESTSQRAEEAMAAWKGAQAQLEAADEALEATGDLEALRRWRRLRQERANLEPALTADEKALKSAEAAEAEALQAHETAKAAVVAARSAFESVKQHGRAFALAQELAPGDACPVCHQTVADVPHHDEPPDWRAAQSDLQAAETAEANAQQALAAARENRARAATALEHRQKQAADLDAELEEAPDPEALDQQLATAEAAEAARATAQGQVKAAAKAYEARQAKLEGLRKAESDAWAAFDRARDRLSAMELEPPETNRTSLNAAWRQLAYWCADQVPGLVEKADVAAAEAAEASSEADKLDKDVREACRSAGVALDSDSDPARSAAQALGAAQQRTQALADALERAEKLRQDREQAEEDRQVAHRVGLHLKKDRFESWLLNRALANLTERGADTLLGLSSGQYALALNDRNEFEVIDHFSANERRTAKSLSGGETFLASLSLALALSSELAYHAGATGERLGALFLDEGFGTLDPETLEVVASALTELGSGGRMVGLVTHVSELAERMPVRFEVRKRGGTSTIEKVAA